MFYKHYQLSVSLIDCQMQQLKYSLHFPDLDPLLQFIAASLALPVNDQITANSCFFYFFIILVCHELPDIQLIFPGTILLFKFGWILVA